MIDADDIHMHEQFSIPCTAELSMHLICAQIVIAYPIGRDYELYSQTVLQRAGVFLSKSRFSLIAFRPNTYVLNKLPA